LSSISLLIYLSYKVKYSCKGSALKIVLKLKG
jgi:hypothetical protein